MNYEVVIGCEVHVQLLTNSKAFCACENRFGGSPNTRVCPVCVGLPGSMPATNRAMVECAVLAGLALNCRIAETTKFDRKNYIYPDLPKGYQISQFDMPVCTNGYLDVEQDGGGTRRVRILRLHMEEDAGKNIHSESGGAESYVDFNRCGTPLLEIVSEPDIRSPHEAVRYVQAIREIMRYLGVSDCNMEEASLRCDANINLWVHEDGETFATPIAEIKNMNSFRSIRTALAYEVQRQAREWQEHRTTLSEAGKTTRGFDEARGITLLQREKEESSDYRYFPEPDLPPINVPKAYVERLRPRIGELPAEKRRRYVEELSLSVQDAGNLASDRAVCEYFEAASAGYPEPKRIANWILSDVRKYLNSRSVGIADLKVAPEALRELVEHIDSGKISGKIAKDVFADMAETGRDAPTVIKAKGLSQIADEGELQTVVDAVIADNPESVSDYRSGTEKAVKYLMGQVMKATRGKANPQLAMSLLKKTLDG